MSSARARVVAPGRVDPLASPAALRLRRPSWRDRRLVVGVVLLLGSTVLGARLLGPDDPGTAVWAARHDLPAGAQLTVGDLEARTVVLGGAAPRYVTAAEPIPARAVLAHAVGRGELVPVGAVSVDREASDRRTVTIPVERFHASEDLARGDRVDVYVTPEGSGAVAQAPSLLVSGAQVEDVEDGDAGFGAAGGTRGVVVSVLTAAVAPLVGGLGRGSVDLVRLPGGAP